MKIIENHYQGDVSQPVRVTCEHCGSVLEVDEDEFVIGEFGLKGVECAVCGEMTYTDKSIPLTPANVCYPQHFSMYNSDKCKPLSDENINAYIGRTLNMIDKNTDYAEMASGDTLVLAYKSDEDCSEVHVVVCKNYAETYVEIPCEKF